MTPVTKRRCGPRLNRRLRLIAVFLASPFLFALQATPLDHAPPWPAPPGSPTADPARGGVGQRCWNLRSAGTRALKHMVATTNIHVSPNGSDANDGSRDKPFRSIDKAASVATPGTTVRVAPGTYQGGFKTWVNGTATAPIRYLSEVKWGARIVPAVFSKSDTAWENRGDHVIIDGFEVDGSRHPPGGAWRWGIYTSGSHSTITNTKVHDIARDPSALGDHNGGAGVQGDGYYGGTDIDLTNNIVYNVGPPGRPNGLVHGIYASTPANIENNLVHGVPGVGIHLWHDAHHVNILNNTVFGNGAGILVGAGDFVRTRAPNDHTVVANNIVYDNAQNGITEQGLTGTHNVYSHNLVYRNGTDWNLKTGMRPVGTVAADPKFVNYIPTGGGDYRPAPGSPAIDAARSVCGLTADLDGAPRGQGLGTDIGAYEHKAPTTPATPTRLPEPPAADIVVKVTASGDQYRGMPKFQLVINGQAWGPVHTVTALRGTGTQDFRFRPISVPSGLSSLGVRFLNDAHRGDGADRNLHIKTVQVNGIDLHPFPSGLYRTGDTAYVDVGRLAALP